MKLALVSLNQVWENKNSNLELCKKYIQNASKEKVDLIVFPEMTLTGFSNNISQIAEDFESSETIQNFSNLALQYNTAINFGVVIKDRDKALNQSVFIGSNGEVLANYSKIHPFSFSGEDKFYNAGSELTIVNYKDLNIGLTICYDLRFPELYTSISPNADIILNIANWPAKRVDHWLALLKARAIENQIFIAGVNRVGVDGNNLEYIESSKVFNANGEEVSFEQVYEMKIYSIDTSYTKRFKNVFNTTNDRKPELYKGFLNANK